MLPPTNKRKGVGNHVFPEAAYVLDPRGVGGGNLTARAIRPIGEGRTTMKNMNPANVERLRKTGPIAEHVRKIGAPKLKSIGEIGKTQRLGGG
jgi:hypothetical protein